MKFINCIAILFALFACSTALFTHINPREDFCIFKKLQENDKLNVNYVTSGQNEQKVVMRIFDVTGKVVKELIKQREGNVDIVATLAGSYKVCWRPMDNQPKVLSFEITVGDRAVAAGENVDKVNQEVKKAYRSLEQIFRNQHYQHTREETHRRDIGSLETKVKLCAFLKIFVLISIAVIQVYILTGFFKGRKEFVV